MKLMEEAPSDELLRAYRDDGRRAVLSGGVRPVKSIRLPNFRSVSVAEYVRCWKALKAMNPRAEVRGFYWFPAEAREILRSMSDAVEDRINKHEPLREDRRGATDRHLARIKAGKIRRECKWCGSGFVAERLHHRFCCFDCHRSYDN